MGTNKHVWSFSIVGGVKRVNLDTGADLVHLDELDPKLWTALSCPVDGLEMDKKTLQMIDTDNDGQIRVPEVLEAVRWILSVIKNPDDLLKGENTFPLSAINEQTETGAALLASARTILKNLGKEGESVLTVDDTSDTQKIFAGTRFNGDGVITEDTADDPELKSLIKEIISCEGSCPDRSGKPGINAEILNRFTDNCKTYYEWYSLAENQKDTIWPFGDHTQQAYERFAAIQAKAEDYFLRCKLAGFDPPSREILNNLTSRVETIAPKNLTACIDEIAGYPLAKIEYGKPLPLSEGINPAWQDAMRAFRQSVTDVIYPGKNALTETEWQAIASAFNSFRKWQNDKPVTLVESLGYKRIRDILEGRQLIRLAELIEQDLTVQKEAEIILQVDKMVRFYRDIMTLLNNFVTFYDFYSPDRKAIFEAGTLYIDQRSCDLCIRVRDMARHSLMVSYSGMYLMYCHCVSRKTNEKMTIVAALTNGDIDNIVTGRNGVFYDRNGTDWDATIIKIVENPISIRQAFWTPYRKVSRLIEKQINKVAAAKEEKVTETASKSIEEAPSKIAPAGAPKPPAQPFDLGKFMGIFAAIGLAIGAIGTALATIFAGFLGLEWWKMPIAAVGVLLAISGPSMIIAALKLRKRNLAPLLDANGWAINARAVVNIYFGNTLTHLAKLPKGAKINLNDPFTKKKRPIIPLIIVFLILITAAVYFLWKNDYVNIDLLNKWKATEQTGE